MLRPQIARILHSFHVGLLESVCDYQHDEMPPHDGVYVSNSSATQGPSIRSEPHETIHVKIFGIGSIKMFKSGMQTIFSTQGTGSVSVSYRPEEKVGKGARSLRFWLEVCVCAC